MHPIHRGAERLRVVDPVEREVRLHGGALRGVRELMEERRAKPRSHVPGTGALNERPRAVDHVIRPDAHPDHLTFKAETRGVRDRAVLPILQRERVASFQTSGKAFLVIRLFFRIVPDGRRVLKALVLQPGVDIRAVPGGVRIHPRRVETAREPGDLAFR